MIRLKNEIQIQGIRKSCKLLADMYNHIIPKVTAGMSTKDIDDLCVEYITRHGGKPAWYREDFPGAGDLVSLDVGIDLDGYISDSAVTLMIGDVAPAHKKLVEVTRQCLAAGIAACKVGNRIGDISKAVFEVAEAAGYGVVYDYCGHGVGLDVHEDPSIPNVPSRGPNPRIQPGMVLAIEPMINLGTADVDVAQDGWTVLTCDGAFSAHEEHTVAVFKDHTEILTARDDPVKKFCVNG